MTAARRTAAAIGSVVLQAMSMLRASPRAVPAGKRLLLTEITRRVAPRLLMPTIFKAASAVPMIGGTLNKPTQSSSNQLPTIGLAAPTNADHRQDGCNDRQACIADQRSAIDRFNDWHRKAGTGLVAEPIGEPTIKVDGPTAATEFVRWAAEHDLAREWKVDDLWYLASEDFAPAHGLILPPRRVFLGALKKTPGVTCTPNRRVYDRNGNLLGKTTFYQLPTLATAKAAAEPLALRVVKHAA